MRPITVSPDGVTFTLPAATDCSDEGAICTQDDRMLSSQPVSTVRAPSQQAASKPGRDCPVGRLARCFDC